MEAVERGVGYHIARAVNQALRGHIVQATEAAIGAMHAQGLVDQNAALGRTKAINPQSWFGDPRALSLSYWHV